jgi:hypothetical protein
MGVKIIMTKLTKGEVSTAILSGLRRENVLGNISPKNKTSTAAINVDINATKNVFPKKYTNKTVIRTDMAIFTKLFPTRIVARKLSRLETNLYMICAFLTLLDSIWRSRILFKTKIAVSEAEKNADSKSKISIAGIIHNSI